MRIALFGGSFDPVHHGHLLLAQDAVEALNLDKLLFIPAGINPHKLHAEPKASANDRLMLLEAAIAGVARFEVEPLELEREGPSFTIDTVETLQRRWPEASFFLLLGEDNLPKLHSWSQFDRLRQLVHFVCFGRPGHQSHPAPVEIARRLERHVDISSTEVRQRIARGLSIQYLVPETVRSLIYSHALYQ